MRILLCNDDGIHAPGIIAMRDALVGEVDADAKPGAPRFPPLGEVMTVAPLTAQSATGHGITFRTPLIIQTVDVNERFSGVAVDGRPADCIKLALSELWPAKYGPGSRPDVVVSGMNAGANVGINVLYSGTVAAALEAAFLGVPSIAVSLHLGTTRPRFDVAAGHARRVIDQLLAAGSLPPHSCTSINVPLTREPGPMPPVRVCPMNAHGMIDAYRRHTNPLGETYFWANGTPLEFHATEPGSDVQLLLDGHITVTPLRFDLTAPHHLSMLESRLK